MRLLSTSLSAGAPLEQLLRHLQARLDEDAVGEEVVLDVGGVGRAGVLVDELREEPLGRAADHLVAELAGGRVALRLRDEDDGAALVLHLALVGLALVEDLVVVGLRDADELAVVLQKGDSIDI